MENTERLIVNRRPLDPGQRPLDFHLGDGVAWLPYQREASYMVDRVAATFLGGFTQECADPNFILVDPLTPLYFIPEKLDIRNMFQPVYMVGHNTVGPAHHTSNDRPVGLMVGYEAGRVLVRIAGTAATAWAGHSPENRWFP